MADLSFPHVLHETSANAARETRPLGSVKNKIRTVICLFKQIVSPITVLKYLQYLFIFVVVTKELRYPFAYFITFTTYGTWLHGDKRKSVDPKHNQYISLKLKSNKGLYKKMKKNQQYQTIF